MHKQLSSKHPILTKPVTSSPRWLATCCAVSLALSVTASSARGEAETPLAADPASKITQTSTAEPAAGTYRFRLDGSLVRVTRESKTTVETVATVPLEGPLHQLVEYRHAVYVASGLKGIAVIDVRDPQHPVLLGYVGAGNQVIGAATNGTQLYARVQGGEILPFDVFDPVRPIERPRAVASRLPSNDASARISDDDERPRVSSRPPKRKGLGMTIAGGSVFGAMYLWPLVLSPFDGTLAVPVAGPLIAVGRSGATWALPLALINSVGQAVGLGLLVGGAIQLTNSSPSTVARQFYVAPNLDGNGLGFVAGGRF